MSRINFSRASLLAAVAFGAIAQATGTNGPSAAASMKLHSRELESYELEETSSRNPNPREPGTESYEFFEEANANPNDTRSVTFKLFDWAQDQEMADREWTWRE